jgi:hypothetical protein
MKTPEKKFTCRDCGDVITSSELEEHVRENCVHPKEEKQKDEPYRRPGHHRDDCYCSWCHWNGGSY